MSAADERGRPLVPRRCECGDRAIHDAGSCARCGKPIPVEVLAREGLAGPDALDAVTVA